MRRLINLVGSKALWRLQAIVILLPWLNPFASGPSPSVIPWLVALSCSIVWVAFLIAFKLGNGVCASKPIGQGVGGAIAAAWLFAGVVSSAMGLAQYFGTADLFGQWVNSASMGEAYANLRQRNQFATLTNVALAALIWFAGRESFVLQMPKYVPSALVSMSCVLAVGNAASQSRTGIAQLALVCILCVLWGLWRHALVRKLLTVAVVTYAVAAFALPVLAGFDLSTFGIAARLRDGDQSCASRIILWSNVLHLIAQKPWLGWGWGELDFAHFITLYNSPRFCEILDNAHNLPLHLAVELGIPAALLICGGFMWWAVRQKPWAERDGTRQLAWAVLAVILLHSMLEYPLWYGPFQIAFWICIALLWQQKPPSDVKNRIKKASNRSLVHILLRLVAINLIAFIAYTAWDYRRISQIYLPPESRAEAYRTDTLNKIRSSWLFADQVQFAELLTTTLTLANAEWTFDTARHLLHYSPEARVVEKLIESAVLLGKDVDALAYLARYQAAFPAEYAKWSKGNQSAVKN